MSDDRRSEDRPLRKSLAALGGAAIGLLITILGFFCMNAFARLDSVETKIQAQEVRSKVLQADMEWIKETLRRIEARQVSMMERDPRQPFERGAR